jgi:hypothetical protein
MTSTNQRLEQVRNLLHNPISDANSAALAELLESWPDEDPSGRKIAEELGRAAVEQWSSSLESSRATLARRFPEWLGKPRKVSVRLCGGETERREPNAEDEYIDAVLYGVADRFQAVCVDPRRARTPDPGEMADGVVWLIAPPASSGGE